MLNTCAVCGKGFVARRNTSKYCGDSCRKRASRGVENVTVSDVTVNDVTVSSVTVSSMLPDNFGLADCQCRMCVVNRYRPPKDQKRINHGRVKPFADLGDNEINRITLPGDADYNGVWAGK